MAYSTELPKEFKSWTEFYLKFKDTINSPIESFVTYNDYMSPFASLKNDEQAVSRKIDTWNNRWVMRKVIDELLDLVNDYHLVDA